jgi:hypothetical protein
MERAWKACQPKPREAGYFSGADEITELSELTGEFLDRQQADN